MHDIEQIVVYSTGLDTPVFFDFETKTKLYSDGDGLIPKKSLLFPKIWQHPPQFIEFKNEEHAAINKNNEFIKFILTFQ
jgi:hypothetical protein